MEEIGQRLADIQSRMGPDHFELVRVDAAGIPISEAELFDSEATEFFQQEAERARRAMWIPPLAAWSPDNGQLAIANCYGISIWWVESGTLAVAVAGVSSAVTALAWSPDGSHLATITVSTADEYEARPDDRYGLAWSPDSQRVAVTCHGRSDWGTAEARVWNLTPNGALMTAPVPLGELCVLDLATERVERIKGDRFDAIVSAGFLPDDSNRIVAHLRRGGVLQFELIGSKS